MLTTLLHILVSSLMVIAIWRTMTPGHIFDWLGDWLQRILPEPIHKPVFDCPVCMYPYYGTPIWLLILNADPVTWQRVVVFVIAGMGVTIVLMAVVSLPSKLEELNEKSEADEWR